MKIQIKNRFTGEVIYESESKTVKDAVLLALKSGANLSRANLSGANLSWSNLSGANMSGADLSGADLYVANLYGANLSGADMYGVNLSRANLSEANLSEANLSGADMYGANLYGANLSEAYLLKIVSQRSIVADGDLVVWKKVSGGNIIKLLIPKDARRVGGVVSRKCRAEFAIVLEGSGKSARVPGFSYKEGELVRPDNFDPNPLVECSNGIHFFITKQEAEEYQL